MASSTKGQQNWLGPASGVAGMFLRTGNAAYPGGMAAIAGLPRFHGQNYHIAGTTKNNGAAAPRTVYIMSVGNPRFIIAQQKTGTDGLFDFKYLLAGNYTVFASNPDGSQDDVIHANIAAVEM
jgi:hypothetical protein